MNTVKRTIVLIFALMFAFASGCRPARIGVTISADSFFDRFIINNSRVYMLCYVEFVNDSNQKMTFSVRGESLDDVINGLLTSKNLEFFILDTDDLISVNEGNVEELLTPEESMTVEAHSTARYYVCFVGDHGGGESKHDRNLPKIIIDQ